MAPFPGAVGVGMGLIFRRFCRIEGGQGCPCPVPGAMLSLVF